MVKSEKSRKFLAEALKRYGLGRDYIRPQYLKAIEDTRFSLGDQWGENEKAQRRGRPCLTINTQPQFVKSIVNEWRQQRPGIRVRPADATATFESAEVIAGMVRNIETCSKAESIYDSVLENVVRSGVGYYKLKTQYVHEDTFNQEIEFKRIRDPFSVTFDPAAQEVLKSDANWAFVEVEIPKEEFEEEYPKASAGWGSNEYNRQQWHDDKGTVKIAEYYWVEKKEKTIIMFDNGDIMDITGKPAEFVAAVEEENGTKVKIDSAGKEMRRKSFEKVIHWAKITAHDVLEETIIPGDFIPIVPCYGDLVYADGVDNFSGVVRYNKEPARIVNYLFSESVGAIALSPSRPVMITAEQKEGHETQWNDWHTKNYGNLTYNHVEGHALPRRMDPETSANSMIGAALQFNEQMKEGTSMTNKATLGQHSNEKSGVAIAERKEQGQLGSFNYSDNMNQSIAYGGQIAVSMIPKVYDTQQIVRLLGEDNEVTGEMINDILSNIDIKSGKYEVTVEAGISSATKRQASAEFVTSLMSDPVGQQFGTILLPLALKNSDAEGAKEALEAIEGQMQQPADPNEILQ